MKSPVAGRDLPRLLCWTVVLGLALLVTARWAMGVVRGGGGYDFYYYLDIARDWMRLPSGAPLPRVWHLYTPGVYRFYQAFMALGVGDAHHLLALVMALGLADAALITVILWRAGVRPHLVIWGGAWALFLWEHYQGMFGTNEPISLFPVLAGVAIAVRRDVTWFMTRGRWAIAVGLAFGIWIRPQVGLLAVGTGAALFLLALQRRGFMGAVADAAAFTALTTAVLFLLLALQGGSFTDALLGPLQHTASYRPESGSLWSNLSGPTAPDPKLAWLLAAALAALAAALVMPSVRPHLATPSGALFALGALMAGVATYQASVRAYDHYLLLTWVPFAIPAALVLDRLPWSGPPALASCALLVFAFVRPGGGAGPWVLPFSMLSADVMISETYSDTWNEGLAAVAADYPPRTGVIVVPANLTSIYWHLDMRQPTGEYGWQSDENIAVEQEQYCEKLASPEVRAAIFVLNTPRIRRRWIEQARAAGFADEKRVGPIMWLSRQGGPREGWTCP